MKPVSKLDKQHSSIADQSQEKFPMSCGLVLLFGCFLVLYLSNSKRYAIFNTKKNINTFQTIRKINRNLQDDYMNILPVMCQCFGSYILSDPFGNKVSFNLFARHDGCI